MKKSDIINAVADKLKVSKAKAGEYVDAVIGAIADGVCGEDEEVVISDFGRFFVKHIAERKVKAPNSGELITVEAHDRVAFKAYENIEIYSRKHQ